MDVASISFPASVKFFCNMTTDHDRRYLHLHISLIVWYSPRVLIQYFKHTYRKKKADFEVAHKNKKLLVRKRILLISELKKKNCSVEIYLHACSDKTQSQPGFTGMKNYLLELQGGQDLALLKLCMKGHWLWSFPVTDSQRQPHDADWWCWPTCGWTASTSQTI